MKTVAHKSAVRVVLANEPRWLRELIAYSLARLWGEGVALSASNIEETVNRQHATWLVLTLEADSAFAKTYWLESFPSLNIVRLSRDGRSAMVRRSNGEEKSVDNVTLQELVNLLEK